MVKEMLLFDMERLGLGAASSATARHDDVVDDVAADDMIGGIRLWYGYNCDESDICAVSNKNDASRQGPFLKIALRCSWEGVVWQRAMEPFIHKFIDKVLFK